MSLIRYVRKASNIEDPILLAAAQMEPKMRKAFLDAVEAVKGTISLTKLTEAVKAGDAHQVLAILAIDKKFVGAMEGVGLEAGVTSVRDAIQATYANAAKAALLELPKKVGMEISFNMMNPAAVNAINSYTFDLIQQVSAETRQAIQQVMLRGFTEGKIPAQILAKELKETIGLTASQEKALLNYRSMLESGTSADLRQALSRSLRDGRYDRSLLRAINESKGLPQAQVEKMVARYRERYLTYRANMIGRTECLPAETLVNGAVVRTIRRRWYDGPMVDIFTSEGRKFSTTPNHPMLSKRGWLFSNEITEGDYLVCDSTFQNAGLGDSYIENRPATLGNIFETLRLVGVSERESCVSEDFHGDGREGYVEAFSPHRELSVGRFAPLYKHLVEDIFAPADFSRTTFCEFCGRLLSINKQVCLCTCSQRHSNFLQTVYDSITICSKAFTQGYQRLAREIAALDFVRGQVGTVVSYLELGVIPEQVLSSFLQRPAYAGISYDSLYPAEVCLQEPSYSSCAVPCKVELDRVLSIRVRAFSGHVFSLETPYGYYTISGAYTGNSIRASNAGQRELWKQARDQGLLGDNVRRKWHASMDSATCEVCADLDGETAGLDEEFAPGILQPPDPHPHCRCSLSLVFGVKKAA